MAMDLHNLSRSEPGLRRWLHGIRAVARHRPGSVLRRLRSVARLLAARLREVVQAGLLDLSDRLSTRPPPILRMQEGEQPLPGHRAVAVMVQYSPSGSLSGMVLHQIATYRDLGFAVVVVSTSPVFPEEDWQAARRDAALVVHRRNGGLDFGAWKDLVPVALERWPDAEELLLVNDSVLGPIRPLGPVVDTMRAAGPGVFGLIESLQGGPHLQSWFTLASGRAAVADVARFLARLKLSRSKWKIVQRGELRLARAMRAAGHRVAALHGYEALVRTALADPAEYAYLKRALPAWLAGADPARHHAILVDRPLNPSHHLWHVLAGPAACPFIKTELVRRNPGKLPEVEAWADFVPADLPCPVPMLRAHLEALGP